MSCAGMRASTRMTIRYVSRMTCSTQVPVTVESGMQTIQVLHAGQGNGYYHKEDRLSVLCKDRACVLMGKSILGAATRHLWFPQDDDEDADDDPAASDVSDDDDDDVIGSGSNSDAAPNSLPKSKVPKQGSGGGGGSVPTSPTQPGEPAPRRLIDQMYLSSHQMLIPVHQELSYMMFMHLATGSCA